MSEMGFEIERTSQLNISNILPNKSGKKQYSQGVPFYECSLAWKNKRKGQMSVSTRESPFLPF